MDEDWYINLGRMHVDGEKMKTEGADTWNTNPNISQITTTQELLDVNISKTTFL